MFQVGAHFEALDESVLVTPLDSRYTQVGSHLISVQVCVTIYIGFGNRISGSETKVATFKYKNRSLKLRDIKVMAVAFSHRRSLLILVEDMNDNAPVFGPHPPSVTLGEDSRVGDYVATLAATDKDSGVFGQVSYSLDPNEPDSSMFEVSARTGVVRLSRNLDYERASLHQLKVLASDRGGVGGGGNTATAALLVKVHPNFIVVCFDCQIIHSNPERLGYEKIMQEKSEPAMRTFLQRASKRAPT